MADVRRFISIVVFTIFILACTGAQALELRILYVNDFHGFGSGERVLSSGKTEGGVARLAALAERLRREKPSLFLAAGDMIQGDAWANLFSGRSVVEVMNVMGFDAMVLGNHEFDFGSRALQELIETSQFPVLGANVQGLKGLRPYVVREIKGLKVAVVGIVTEDTAIYAQKNLQGIRFQAHAEAVQERLDELRGKVDLIVVLSHIGYLADLDLARNVRGIDVIVGGHSHTRLETPVRVGRTIIVQAWKHGRALGVLDLDVEKGEIEKASGHLEPVESSLSEDEAVRSIVEFYRKQMGDRMNEVIGRAGIDLDCDGVRTGETNFGDLVADIVRESSGADLAIINGGSIRRSIPKGDIRLGDIYSALPFDNYIISIRLSGKDLVRVLEHGVSAVEAEEGRFPQVSGLSLSFSRSGLPGSRIRQVMVGGEPVADRKVYSVATNDYLTAGGDGYTLFEDVLRRSGDFANVGGTLKGKAILYNNPGKWIRDEVADYIRMKRVILMDKGKRIIEGEMEEGGIQGQSVGRELPSDQRNGL
jgi:5'-nucleotidase / UDP-sugar diphosphatase